MSLGAEEGARSPVARVLEVKGKATIVDPDDFHRPAAGFGVLYAGDQLTVDKDSSVVLVFKADGHVERAVAGTLKLTASGCEPKTGVEQVAMSEQNKALVGRISKGPRGIIQGGVVVAGSRPPGSRSVNPAKENDFAVLASNGQLRPIPESTVLTLKPNFSWPPVPKAGKYTLNLSHVGNRVWSTTIDATQVNYPGEPLLKSGAMYSWDVTTILNNMTTTICAGVFHTASDQQRADAEALEKLIANPDIPNLALAAMWYKQNGLVTEAIAAHQQLAKLNGDPAVYWALSELCWQAGRDEELRATPRKRPPNSKRRRKAKGASRPRHDHARITSHQGDMRTVCRLLCAACRPMCLAAALSHGPTPSRFSFRSLAWRGAMIGGLCALACWYLSTTTFMRILDDRAFDGCFSSAAIAAARPR